VHAWSKGRVAGYRYFGDRWIDQDLINGKCPRMMHTQVPRLTPRSSVQDGGAAGQGSTEGQDSAYIIDSIDRSCETADVARSSTRRGATNPCIHRSGISRGAGRGHARRHTARGWGRPSACKRRAKKRQRWGEKTDDASSRGRTCGRAGGVLRIPANPPHQATPPEQYVDGTERLPLYLPHTAAGGRGAVLRS
jgi:hypothetical protein